MLSPKNSLADLAVFSHPQCVVVALDFLFCAHFIMVIYGASPGDRAYFTWSLALGLFILSAVCRGVPRFFLITSLAGNILAFQPHVRVDNRPRRERNIASCELVAFISEDKQTQGTRGSRHAFANAQLKGSIFPASQCGLCSKLEV